MARDSNDLDGASSASGQSNRPPLSRHQSDTQSNHSEGHSSHMRQKHHQHQKQHHAGRLHHARVPSSKALHKARSHGHAHTTVAHQNQHHRRGESPDNQSQSKRPSAHRRATSEVKISQQSTSANIPKSFSQTSLKRNRSYGDVQKRSKSSDKLTKLKRNSSGYTTVTNHRPKSSKSQVHFDLGSDGAEDEGEWVDASGSNSPHMSRKGSINSSAQSSLRPAMSAGNSRPQTPNDAPAQRELSTPDHERNNQQRYLTTRILQRTPSHGAPPQMTNDIVQVEPRKISPDMSGQETATLVGSNLVGSNKEGLTSRFVDTPASGVTSEGSFYRHTNDPRPADDVPRRPKSMANLSRSIDEEVHRVPDDRDDSALVPKPARRSAAQPAETSRIQQKLNLQRASSAIEPGHAGPVGGGITTPLIGVGGPGYDGVANRDPRIAKLRERTGMEYLVVRRYQNPVARSLNRLGRLPSVDKTRRIPRVGTASSATKKSLELPVRHSRNVSMPDPRRPNTPSNSATTRTTTVSSFEGDDESRLNERLSGSSLVGSSEDDGTMAILRNLWEKSMDLSASGD